MALGDSVSLVVGSFLMVLIVTMVRVEEIAKLANLMLCVGRVYFDVVQLGWSISAYQPKSAIDQTFVSFNFCRRPAKGCLTLSFTTLSGVGPASGAGPEEAMVEAIEAVEG